LVNATIGLVATVHAHLEAPGVNVVHDFPVGFLCHVIERVRRLEKVTKQASLKAAKIEGGFDLITLFKFEPVHKFPESLSVLNNVPNFG
jgi:hypothetical protein